jgi:hypothetical protein
MAAPAPLAVVRWRQGAGPARKLSLIVVPNMSGTTRRFSLAMGTAAARGAGSGVTWQGLLIRVARCRRACPFSGEGTGEIATGPDALAGGALSDLASDGPPTRPLYPIGMLRFWDHRTAVLARLAGDATELVQSHRWTAVPAAATLSSSRWQR